MKHKGVLTVVSGFSGAGKGTIIKELLNRYDTYALSISVTTRKPRVSSTTGEMERDGVEYFFLDQDEFRAMINQDALIEYAVYRDNYYGTPQKYVEEQLQEGKDVLLEIEVQGAAKIKEKFPETALIFVTAPTAAELKNRLVKRGTESPEEIAGRLARAVEESEFIRNYDYVLVNDDLNEAVESLHAIVTAEHQHSTNRHLRDFVDQLTGELKDITKEENLL